MISTALVAVIVSLLTVTAMGVLALDEPATTERTIMPAAGINAASVDGKSAVGYTSKKTLRRYKLVATGGAGMLPSNIVRPFWGLIRNKPGILADNQISWDEVKNKPAGFAGRRGQQGDGGITITQVAGPEVLNPGSGTWAAEVTCPAGAVAIGGGLTGVPGNVMQRSYRTAPDTWYVGAKNIGGSPAYFTPYATCMSVDPGSAITTASKG